MCDWNIHNKFRQTQHNTKVHYYIFTSFFPISNTENTNSQFLKYMLSDILPDITGADTKSDKNSMSSKKRTAVNIS